MIHETHKSAPAARPGRQTATMDEAVSEDAGSSQTPSAGNAGRRSAPAPLSTGATLRIMAVLRIAMGFVFAWTFLDKLMGFNRSTPPERAWLNGGHPAQGFMESAEGPLQHVFAATASGITDTLFMAGVLGVGIAFILGIGMRIAAVSSAVMMLLMYLAIWPFAAGTESFVVDYHIVYALSGLILAATSAGNVWGLGRLWGQIPFVSKHQWLI